MKEIRIFNNMAYRTKNGYNYHNLIHDTLKNNDVTLSDEQIVAAYQTFKRFGKDLLKEKLEEVNNTIYTVLSWQLKAEAENLYDSSLKEWQTKLLKHFENSFKYNYADDLEYYLETRNNQEYKKFLITNPKPFKIKDYYELSPQQRKEALIKEFTEQFYYDNTYKENVYSKYVDGTVTVTDKEPDWFKTFGEKHSIMEFDLNNTAMMFLNNIINKYKLTIDKNFMVVNNYELETYGGCTINLIQAVQRNIDYNNKLTLFINEKLKSYEF